MTATESRRDAVSGFDPRRDVSFVVVSCDRYRDLWDPFFGCMERYWPDCPFQVFLATNEAPYDRKGVSMIHIGPDRDYASNLIAAVNAVPTPWVITWVEDAIFTEPIESGRLLSILSEAVAAGASYLKLTSDTPLSFDDSNGERIGETPRGVKYRSAMGTCLYSKELLNKLLVPGMSAWEMDKSDKADDLAEKFMTLTVREARRPLLPAINAVIKGEWYWPAPAFLRKEGFASILPGRRRQPLWRYFWIQAYLFRLFLYRLARRHWYA
jgi:hypothetical protein